MLSVISNPCVPFLQELSVVTFVDQFRLHVYWDSSSRQAILQTPKGWFATPNCNIFDTLGLVFQVQPHRFVAKSIKVFDAMLQPWVTGEEINLYIYDCLWSDFACDKLILHMTVHAIESIRCQIERLLTARTSRPLKRVCRIGTV